MAMNIRAKRRLRSSIDVTAFILFALGIAWIVLRGADAMNYNWQWYRVSPFVYEVEDGVFYAGPLLRGLRVTLILVAESMVLTVVFGLVAALLARSNSLTGRWLSRTYIEVVRNTPLLVQIYIFYFVLGPILGLDRFFTAVLVLAVYEGAYTAEIFRSGIEAVPKGQWEAARTIALSRFKMYRYVVLPQAVRLVLPPLTGIAVSLIKGSAIASVVAIFDLTTEGRNVISETFMTFEIWFTVAAMYLVLTTSLSFFVSYLERRLEARGA